MEKDQGETIGFLTLKNPMTRLFLLGLILTLLMFSVFLFGGWYTCNAGGGTLSKLKCIDIDVITACEDIAGRKYKLPENYTLQQQIVLQNG